MRNGHTLPKMPSTMLWSEKTTMKLNRCSCKRMHRNKIVPCLRPRGRLDRSLATLLHHQQMPRQAVDETMEVLLWCANQGPLPSIALNSVVQYPPQVPGGFGRIAKRTRLRNSPLLLSNAIRFVHPRAIRRKTRILLTVIPELIFFTKHDDEIKADENSNFQQEVGRIS